MLPESSSRPLPAKMAHSRNLAHASLETAVDNNDFSPSQNGEALQDIQKCHFHTY